jgi:hypothetical protein
MWKIIQELLPWFLVILIFSQYVIPVIINEETWWIFKLHRKKNVQIPPPPQAVNDKPLEEEIEETKNVVKETKEKVNKVKKKVDDNFKSAKDLKDETDNLI